MRDEIVARRRWLGERDFLDLLAIANILPGPNSTELALHLGRARAGGRGLLVAGALFIGPAVLLTLALAWVYLEHGALPAVGAIAYGVKPVVVAVVAHAVFALARATLTGVSPVAAAAGAFALALLGINEVAVLVLIGAAALLARSARRAAALAVEPVSLALLFALFLKAGALLYGSGYVLLAFLHGDLVERTGWLTEQQLVDAVAAGQVTPGPVLATATFAGYVIAGWAGAALATIAIFVPAFVYVALSAPLLSRIRRSPVLAAALDAVAAASLGLVAAVALYIGRAALVDAFTVALAIVAAALLLLTRVGSAWVIAGGAAAGLASTVAR